MASERFLHRVDRVLSLISSRRNWVSPTPSHASECVPPLWFRGGEHSLGETGWGRPNSDEGTYTEVLYLYRVRYSIYLVGFWYHRKNMSKTVYEANCTYRTKEVTNLTLQNSACKMYVPCLGYGFFSLAFP